MAIIDLYGEMVFGFMVFYPLAKKLSDDDWFLPDF
jgi:hypothetical protein